MFQGKRILVVVPARGGSKGVKLKNIRPLNGVPLVALVGAVVQELHFVDRAIVSTDHPEIAGIAKESGLAVPFMRPDELSGDFVADWAVLHDCLLKIEALDEIEYDIIVMLQPTSPFRKPRHVTQAIHKLVEEQLDAVWTVSETDSKAHPLKQLVITDDGLSYYDERGKTIVARQQLDPVYHRNGVAYAMTRECIVEQKTLFGRKTHPLVIEEPMVNIDTELDLKMAEFLMSIES